HQLGGTCKLGRLRRGKAEIRFEGHPAIGVRWARVSAQVVLAGGQEGGLGLAGGAVLKGDLPLPIVGAAESFNALAALDLHAGMDGGRDESGIERLARERSRGEGQRGLGGTRGGGEADTIDGHSAKRGYVDAQRVQILKRFAAQELSADLVARSGLAFEQADP